MAVERESFTAEQLAGHAAKARLTGVVRQRAGQWFAEIEVEGNAALRDGRRIELPRRRVSLRMTPQRGRKPSRIPA